MPDNDETKAFINAELFDNMNSTSIFINVGRRAVINEDDLYNALKKKKIKGAILDMFEILPNPITNKFRRLRNVIIFPGVAAISQETNVRLHNHINTNISLFLNEEKPNNIINGA